MEYYKWEKGKNFKLGRYYNTAEFACSCTNKDCVNQQISKELVDRLDRMRHAIGQPMTITSGFRCSKKQEEIRKSGQSTVVAKKSSHEEGQAADVWCVNFKELTRLVESLFDNIGYAKTFLHVDMREPKADGSKRKWLY